MPLPYQFIKRRTATIYEFARAPAFPSGDGNPNIRPTSAQTAPKKKIPWPDPCEFSQGIELNMCRRIYLPPMMPEEKR